GTAFEEMARERVPQHMRRDALAEAGASRGVPHDRPQRLPGETTAPRIHEHAAAVSRARVEGPDVAEVATDPLRGLAADRNEALLASLSVADDGPRVQGDCVQGQPQTLGGAHAGGVEQLEHGTIASAARLGQVG